jgi:hypothetical protein
MFDGKIHSLGRRPKWPRQTQTKTTDERFQSNPFRNMDDQIVNHSKRLLPRRADRTKIIEQAKLVQAQARALAKQLDQSLPPRTAEQPGQRDNTAIASFVANKPAFYRRLNISSEPG